MDDHAGQTETTETTATEQVTETTETATTDLDAVGAILDKATARDAGDEPTPSASETVTDEGGDAAGDDTASEAPEPDAVKEPKGDDTPVLAPDLTALAKGIGYTAEQIAAYDPEVFGPMLVKHLETTAAAGEQFFAERDAGATAPATPSAAEPPAPKTTEAVKPVEAPEIDLDPEVYGQEVVDAFTAERQRHAAQLQERDARIDAIEKRFTAIDEATEQQHEERWCTSIDNAIAALVEKESDTYATVFGKGSGLDMNPKGLEVGNRMALRRTMDALAAGLSRAGTPVESFDGLFKMAVRAKFGGDDFVTKKVNKALSEKARAASRDRRGQFIAEPGLSKGTVDAAARREDEVGERLARKNRGE